MAASPAPDRPNDNRPAQTGRPISRRYTLGVFLAAISIAAAGASVLSAGPSTTTLKTASDAAQANAPAPGQAPAPAGSALHSVTGAVGGALGQGQSGGGSGGSPEPTESPSPTSPPPSDPGSGSGGGGSGGSGSSGGGSTGSPGGCTLTAKLVPTCDGALWGLYLSLNGNWAQDVANTEQRIGRSLTVIKRYHDFSGAGSAGAFPTADEKQVMASGHVMHFAWTSKVWSNNSTPSWADIAAGKHDDIIDGEARRLAAVSVAFFIDFDHEMDGAARSGNGNGAEYVAAYRHIRARFAALGVTNAVWAWVPTGWNSHWSQLASYYPGDDVVDWIGWDPYNFDTKHWQEPVDVFRAFYDWLDKGGLGSGAAAKPRLLGEYGSLPDPNDPQHRSEWLSQVPNALAALPKLRAVEYWSDREMTLNDNDYAGFTQAGHSPYAQLSQ